MLCCHSLAGYIILMHVVTTASHTHTHTHTVKAAAVLKYTNEHYDRVHMKSPAVL